MNKRIKPEQVKEIKHPFKAEGLEGTLGELKFTVNALIEQYGEEVDIRFKVESTPDPYYNQYDHEVVYVISWTELEE